MLETLVSKLSVETLVPALQHSLDLMKTLNYSSKLLFYWSELLPPLSVAGPLLET
jgi:hypothetical protein